MRLPIRVAVITLAGGGEVALSVIALPFLTHFLSVAEFGRYYLLLSVLSFIFAALNIQAHYVLSTLTGWDNNEPHLRSAASTLAWLNLAIAAALLIVVGALAWFVPHGLSESDRLAAVILAVALVFQSLWNVYLSVMILRKTPERAAAVSFGSAILGVACSVGFAAYGLNGEIALASGFAASWIVKGTTAGLSMLGLLPWSKSLIRDAFWTTVRVLPTCFIEAGYPAIERSLLASFTGVSTLAIYVHGQQYRGLLKIPLNAFSSAIYSETIAYARAKDAHFVKTREVWRAAVAMLTVGGLVSVPISAPVISLLTHDKFTAAAPFVPAWIMVQILAEMGKPSSVTLLAHGKSHLYSWSVFAGYVVGVICLASLLPFVGAWAGLVAACIAQIVQRVLIIAGARRVHPTVPLQDAPNLFGFAVVGAALAYHYLGYPTPVQSAMVTAALVLLTMIVFKSILGTGVQLLLRR